MPGTKRSPPTVAGGGKKTKQLGIAAIMAQAQRPAAATLVVEALDTDAPVLEQALVQELEQANEAYLSAWGEKCRQRSHTGEGGTSREDVDLDARGMRAVVAFGHAAALAGARGAVLDASKLEAMVLVVRNDCVHQHSHVSRAAHAALCSYLAARPYARLARHDPSAAGPYAGCPYVITAPSSAWTPLQE